MGTSLSSIESLFGVSGRTGLGSELQGSTSPYDPPLGLGIDEASGSGRGSPTEGEARKADDARGAPPMRRGALNMIENGCDYLEDVHACETKERLNVL